jgi:hypothetical protein
MKLKSISKTVVEIIKSLLPELEKYQTEFQNRDSRYKKIAGDREKRLHIHAYMPESLYRQLKQIHDCLNFFSMGQILREIIEIYLKEFVDNGIVNTVNKFVRSMKEWERKKLYLKNKEIVRQLSLLRTISRSITINFDKNYHPYSIKFL